MKSIEEIRQLKNYYVGDLYNSVRGEQTTDQSYIDDTFIVPDVKSPHKLIRSGIGYEAVSAPAEQIITSNPQVFFSSDRKGDKEAIQRLSYEVNQVWIPAIKKQIPNIFKEIVKNKLARGESYIRVVHNESWVTRGRQKWGLPVLLLCPDPMIVYGSPEEDDCGWIPNTGVPNEVIISYPRQPLDVIARYPSWKNPKGRKLFSEKQGERRELAEWWEYHSKDQYYAEADGETVINQKNLYGWTPFIRKYSGFGKRSPEGELSDLIVSDIRMTRDLIKEECGIRSDISSILHIFAHKPVTITIPSGEEIDEESIKQNIEMGAYGLNILPLPGGEAVSKIHWGDTIALPGAEVFQHLRDIRNEIKERHPLTMAGFPIGSSGRQQDLSGTAAMNRYESVIENTQDEVAQAVAMALAIVKKVPGLRPDTIQKADLDVKYQVEVKLKARDPIEEDRLATLGARLQAQGIIDLETNLVQYQGKTQDEAEEIITNLLIDRVTFNSPEVADLLGWKAAEKAGMADELKLLRERRAMAGEQQRALNPLAQVAPTTQERQVGETQTALGREMIDQALVNRGQRKSPEGYFRQ